MGRSRSSERSQLPRHPADSRKAVGPGSRPGPGGRAGGELLGLHVRGQGACPRPGRAVRKPGRGLLRGQADRSPLCAEARGPCPRLDDGRRDPEQWHHRLRRPRRYTALARHPFRALRPRCVGGARHRHCRRHPRRCGKDDRGPLPRDAPCAEHGEPGAQRRRARECLRHRAAAEPNSERRSFARTSS